MTTPLLIGGATTSRVHTAVKIEPAYSSPVVHVADASRAVGVAGSLLDADGARRVTRRRMPRGVRAGPPRARGTARPRDAADARRRARQPARSWTGRRHPPRPSFLGVRAFEDYPLDELVERIDWTPFFTTWELRGAYPAILADPNGRRGGPRPATRTRQRAARPDRRRAAAHGRRPSSGSGRPTRPPDDDIVLFDGRGADDASSPASTPSASRWPSPTGGRTCRSPTSSGRPGVAGLHRRVRRHRGHGHDRPRGRVRGGPRRLLRDPGRALADRLAEAFAERLHERVRRELWGYAPDEALSQRRPHRRALPGHPARARLPGARPTTRRSRRCSDLLDAEAPGGHRADRVDGDAARRVVSRPVPVAPGEPLLRDRPDRPRPARGLRPARRRSARPRPSAGWARTWRTTPRPEPRAGPVGADGTGPRSGVRFDIRCRRDLPRRRHRRHRPRGGGRSGRARPGR